MRLAALLVTMMLIVGQLVQCAVVSAAHLLEGLAALLAGAMLSWVLAVAARRRYGATCS